MKVADGSGNGVVVGFGVKDGSGVIVARGVIVAGVTMAVCVSKKDATIVPTPAVTNVSTSSTVGSPAPPQETTRIDTRKRANSNLRLNFMSTSDIIIILENRPTK